MSKPFYGRILLPTVLVLAGLAGETGSRVLAGPVGAHHHGTTSEICVCETARAQNGWCAKCEVGFVASVKISSESLFEMMDPRGHEVDLTQGTCSTCPAAMKSDGFCGRCKMGYVDGRAYLSPLAYLMAQGDTADPEKLAAEYRRLRVAVDRLNECELCAVALFADGRCPRCNIFYRDLRRVSPE